MRGSSVSASLLTLVAAISRSPAVCENPFVDATPITDLGQGTYQGYQGGLYPGGSNERPAAHDRAYDRTSRLVLLNAEGNPDATNGVFVLISIGNSNATMEFSDFVRRANSEPARNGKRMIVDCAEPDQTADIISDPAATYWLDVDLKLAGASLTPLQVQSVWLKDAIPYPAEGFPGHAEIFRDDLRAIVQILTSRYPNLKSVYLSSRIYGGWQPPEGLNPEPYAYEYGFSVKWLIEAQLQGARELNFDPAKGRVRAPWLSWGPYLWADGIHPRSDGLTWPCEDFRDDGAHPSDLGIAKVSDRLLSFFETDPTTVPWYLDCNVADPSAFAKAPEVLGDGMGKVAGGSELTWDSLDPVAGSGTVADVVRGMLSDLRGDRGFARATCLASNVADTPLLIPEDPPAGSGFYYLIRGRNSCGFGTFGDGSIVPDPRDALDSGAPACF
jgi:hypothetical protein